MKLGFFHKKNKKDIKDILEKEEIVEQKIEAQKIETQEIKIQELETKETKTQEVKIKEVKKQEIENEEKASLKVENSECIYKQEVEKKTIEQENKYIEQEKIYFNQIEELKKHGIDIERGIKRFSGKRALYIKYLKEFIKDENMQEIKSCMEAEDYQLVQKKVHALKGIVGNLSIDVLYDNSCQMMEALKQENIEKAKELFQQMSQIYIQVCDLISKIEEE